ncbi:MAG: hypothetical protein IJO13_00405 [Lachnospiraceae bacterium]|nr:hypothetical protein [Lachnospiraceae bacterium]
MRYIASWSGGKDSTASIILAHLLGLPLDIIVFCEVMYDNKRNISGELPEHMEFIRKTAKLFERWGYEVITLRSEQDYLSFFNRRIKKATKHKDHIGKRFGFPCFGLCGIKRDLKLKPIERYFKGQKDVIQYVGICADEPERLKSLNKSSNKISILAKYGYTQEMAKDLCERFELLSPSYKYTKRGGCWFCPNAKLEEQYCLYKQYPEIWEEFVNLENELDLAFPIWNVRRCTLKERNDQVIEMAKREDI